MSCDDLVWSPRYKMDSSLSVSHCLPPNSHIQMQPEVADICNIFLGVYVQIVFKKVNSLTFMGW